MAATLSSEIAIFVEYFIDVKPPCYVNALNQSELVSALSIENPPWNTAIRKLEVGDAVGDKHCIFKLVP